MLRIRNFETCLGDKAQVGVSSASKHAFIRVNGQDVGTVPRCKAYDAATILSTLACLTGTRIWRLV